MSIASRFISGRWFPTLTILHSFPQRGYERERILQGTDHDEKKATVEDVKRISDQYKTKKRRAHRKSHGLISFQELSRIIAERWKSLPEDEKKIFEAQAQIEKQERLARIEVLVSTPHQASVHSCKRISDNLTLFFASEHCQNSARRRSRTAAGMNALTVT